MSSIPTFKYGYVVGKFINSKGDSDDLDRFPDYIGAKLNPTFTRVRGQYVQPLDSPEFGIHGAMVYHEPVVAGVTDEGFLTGDVDSTGRPVPDAKPGIWLVTGRYSVSLGSQFPSMEIEVLESHTEDDPLDLSTEQKYVPPPGVIVNTLPLPSGGEPGQVYGWTGSSVGWYTPEEGPSAYEVALRNGFSGTVDEWLLSLKGLPGDPGISAYEVAQSQGFSGTIDEWLASLKGLKGDAGFSAYQLAKTNGFSGTVTEWLDSLVGRQGDPGPPGSPTEYIKVGAGRPDQPTTTNGVITGNEPIGAEYRSENAAGVGAHVWMKRPGGKWEVTDGDTGWRKVSEWIVDPTGPDRNSLPPATLTNGALYVRRAGSSVEITSRGTTTSSTQLAFQIPIEFWSDSAWATVTGWDSQVDRTLISTGGYPRTLFHGGSGGWVVQANSRNRFYGMWTVTTQWPSTLPGIPA